MDLEVAGWDADEPEIEYQIAHALRERGFGKRNTRPEERIATQFAKRDEEYRERKGIRNVMARPIAKSVRAQVEKTCRTAYRVLEANANPFIRYGHDMANAGAKAGMEYGVFIQRLVDAAVARYARA
jgi:hypothetical protein